MRRSVTLLVLAGVIPIVALGGTFGALTLRSERDFIIDRGRTDANLAASLISLAIRSNTGAIRMVAQSPSLDGAKPDLARFTVLTRRILAIQRDWHSITLAHGDGTIVFSAPARNDGPSVEGKIDAFVLRRLNASGETQIGGVTTDRSGARFFTIHAPVGGRGRRRLIVSAVIPMVRLERLLRVEPLAPGWTASIITTAGLALMLPGGGQEYVATEPRPVEMWAPVNGVRWSVRITAPAKAFLAPLRRAAALLLGAAALCILLLVLLARMLALELHQSKRRDASELQRQRMEALGRMTGGIAHDFNNLLTPIMISLDLAGQRNPEAGVVRHLDAAMSGIERARTLVSRLLSFSRQQQLSPEPVDLRSLIDDLSDLIAKSLTPAITVSVEIPCEGDAAIADRGQLELAILNLVINARDAMPHGGHLGIVITQDVGRHAVRLGSGTFVAIIVSDTGSGMDADTMSRAIDPFFTTKPTGKGTGLGLSMVDGFSSQSGGLFVLESAYGKGTRASIILPSSTQKSISARIELPWVEASHLRILLVDDDDRVRKAAAEVLTKVGHTVIEAADVEQALSVMNDDRTIDMVVTDFIMPGRSGAELVNLLQADWPNVAVLMVTGHVDDDSSLPANINLLRKPYRRAALLKAVEDAFERRLTNTAAP